MPYRMSPVVFLLAAACLTSLGCFGYHLGARALYRADVRTVYIPMIESDSYRRNLGERLTEAVVKEIETTTPLRVVGSPDADSTLRCRLVSDSKKTIVETRTDEPRVAEMKMNVKIEWVDRRGQPLNQYSQIPLPLALTATEGAEFIPEAGQSVMTAQQEAIVRLASEIVSQMQACW